MMTLPHPQKALCQSCWTCCVPKLLLGSLHETFQKQSTRSQLRKWPLTIPGHKTYVLQSFVLDTRSLFQGDAPGGAKPTPSPLTLSSITRSPKKEDRHTLSCHPGPSACGCGCSCTVFASGLEPALEAEKRLQGGIVYLFTIDPRIDLETGTDVSASNPPPPSRTLGPRSLPLGEEHCTAACHRCAAPSPRCCSVPWSGPGWQVEATAQ